MTLQIVCLLVEGEARIELHGWLTGLEISEFQAACLKGDFKAALKLQDKLALLHTNLFVETSPAPIKYAMSLIGKCANTVRLPMVPATEKAQAAVRQAMVHAGLIN